MCALGLEDAVIWLCICTWGVLEYWCLHTPVFLHVGIFFSRVSIFFQIFIRQASRLRLRGQFAPIPRIRGIKRNGQIFTISLLLHLISLLFC